MNLLKPTNNTCFVIPYEQGYIKSLHQKGKLISEQCSGELNPLLQLAINPYHPRKTISVEQCPPHHTHGPRNNLSG
jgi:hypothetical protein